ncbi:flagellar biosynthesis/type III secretory pathway chaperone [Paenibacillus castaneae]|uniref:flagellar protein FlgN n=1 Tax=Paenibacillus castaneae TaxID=474957 RepID=UPI000C9A135D|nr:flagellar protein FlgN [Paenibacillus castaneae]NIK79345.1 flagellar biosynthesis/type III secretory pathway chaperone [Paenibacillus castaneae]
MNEYIQQILVILQELLDEHRQLIEYGNAKTEAITTNNVETLSYISSKEKKVLQRILELEQRRIFLIGKYMLYQKLTNHRSFKMEKLVQAVYHANEKQQLQAIWQELSDVMKTLQDINEFNQQLVRMTLEHLHFTEDLLLGPTEDEATYHRAVQGMAYNRNSRFNMKS